MTLTEAIHAIRALVKPKAEVMKIKLTCYLSRYTQRVGDTVYIGTFKFDAGKD